MVLTDLIKATNLIIPSSVMQAILLCVATRGKGRTGINLRVISRQTVFKAISLD